MKRTLWIALFLCLVNTTALADKVPPPPPDCPDGSTPDTGHEGEHCSALDCKSDADCKGGLVCKEQPLCLEEKTLAPGRSNIPVKYTFVYGTCVDSTSVCLRSAPCVPGKRCVPAKANTPPASTTASAPAQTPTTSASKPTPTTPTAPTPSPKAGSCAVSSPMNDNAALFIVSLFLGWMTRRRSAQR